MGGVASVDSADVVEAEGIKSDETITFVDRAVSGGVVAVEVVVVVQSVFELQLMLYFMSPLQFNCIQTIKGTDFADSPERVITTSVESSNVLYSLNFAPS